MHFWAAIRPSGSTTAYFLGLLHKTETEIIIDYVSEIDGWVLGLMHKNETEKYTNQTLSKCLLDKIQKFDKLQDPDSTNEPKICIHKIRVIF